MMTSFKALLFLLLCLPRNAQGQKRDRDISALFSDLNAEACSGNGVVASWCDSSVMEVDCSIHPGFDAYACRCYFDASACPEECIMKNVGDDQDPIPPTIKTHYGIMCHGIPEDEPNYVLKSDTSKLLQHCENNAVVANWCNEATMPYVDCLLSPALDEYTCTCVNNAAACPRECIGGGVPTRGTKHAIRCQGIPEDKPNYILE
jgi:hypothetical protein